MDGSGQWMTVREFAQAAGVSIQAVYQRLDKDLSSYLKAENGRKYIHSDALQFVGNSSTCQEVDKHLTSTCQADSSAGELQKELDETRAELDAVRDQLEKLDALQKRTAADLAAARDQRAAAERKTAAAEQAAAVAAAERDASQTRADDLRAQLDAVTGLLHSEQQHVSDLLKALSSSQLLQAGQMRIAMQDEQTPDEQTPAGSEQPAKRGLFSRLFKRKS